MAEWVGQHYKKNFDAESAEDRFVRLTRYVEAYKDHEYEESAIASAPSF